MFAFSPPGLNTLSNAEPDALGSDERCWQDRRSTNLSCIRQDSSSLPAAGSESGDATVSVKQFKQHNRQNREKHHCGGEPVVPPLLNPQRTQALLLLQI